MIPKPPTLLWFRRDLRLADNPALAAAVARGGPIVPVFVWAPEEEGDWPPGGASRWWLDRSLRALNDALRRAGSRLIIRRGPSAEALATLARQIAATGAAPAGTPPGALIAVLWNRLYEPAARARDAAVAAALRAEGILAESFESALLNEPDAVSNQAGGPYRVFTPYHRAVLARVGSLAEPASAPAAARNMPPRAIPAPAAWPAGLAVADLGLEPVVDWAGGLREAWSPGEAGARAALARFMDDGPRRALAADYASGRDRLDPPGVSRLSPHLHFGEISPRRVWSDIDAWANDDPARRPGADAFLRQLVWRDFAHHLLHHFPETPTRPLRPEFERFPWRNDPDRLRAWQRGRTGHPIVDAAMRELWATGWMPNRARMIVGSFLVKDLLISWVEGARWFWDTLVDADLANNTFGWQWIGGCGADAAPYFRVFNPELQAAKFDPRGDYVRLWVPELAAAPAKWIHAPWKASAAERAAAGVELGQTYPRPIVRHESARVVALAAFQSLNKK